MIKLLVGLYLIHLIPKIVDEIEWAPSETAEEPLRLINPPTDSPREK